MVPICFVYDPDKTVFRKLFHNPPREARSYLSNQKSGHKSNSNSLEKNSVVQQCNKCNFQIRSVASTRQTTISLDSTSASLSPPSPSRPSSSSSCTSSCFSASGGHPPFKHQSKISLFFVSFIKPIYLFQRRIESQEKSHRPGLCCNSGFHR